MKQISIKEQKAGLSTEPEARLHQNLQMKCKTSDLAILLPRNYLPHNDQYYTTHRDKYFYLNLRLTQWELQTLSHTNSHTSRRVKMGKKELEAFQVLSPFSPFSLNHTKTIWGNSSDQNYLREQFRIGLCYPRPDQWSKIFKDHRKRFRSRIEPNPGCAVSPFKSFPFLRCIKSISKNSSEKPGQVPELPRSILYSLEQEWWEISFPSQGLLLRKKKKKKATTTRPITNLETAAQKIGKEEKAMEGGRRGLIFRQSTWKILTSVNWQISNFRCVRHLASETQPS